MTRPELPDSPKIREAKRSAARTGLITICVIGGFILIGDALLLVRDVHRGSGIGLTASSAALGVLLLLYMPFTWRRRMARYRTEPPRPPRSTSAAD